MRKASDITIATIREVHPKLREGLKNTMLQLRAVQTEKATLETAAEFNLDPITCALNGGEDYELLFTVPVTDHEKLKNHPDITIIGHLTTADDGANLVTKSGQAVPLQAQGWTSF